MSFRIGLTPKNIRQLIFYVTVKYESTKKYYNRLMNEVSNGIYAVDRECIRYFKSRIIKNRIKGTPLENNPDYTQFETEYDMWEDSINKIHNMRFVYMMALLEAFIVEYIDERGANESTAKSNWDKTGKDNAINKSSSKLNTEYIEFIIESLFEITLNFDQIDKELGSLRNCIVHKNGIIDESDLVLLNNVLNKLELSNQVGAQIILDNIFLGDLLGRVTNIILTCDDQ